MNVIGSKKWNNGNMDLSPAKMKRVNVSHQQEIAAPVEAVFKMVEPAQRSRWQAGWQGQVSYLKPGQVDDTLWTETVTGPSLFKSPGLETHWYTTLYDASTRRYHAVLSNPELAVGKLEIAMEGGDSGTVVNFDFTYTALNEAGNGLFDRGLGERMKATLVELAGALEGHAEAPDQGGPRSLDMRSEGSGSAMASRASMTHEVVVNGDPDECFALACPVAELKWVDGWQFDLVYSESGINETGCIFTEAASATAILRSLGANTQWYTTLFDTSKRVFNAVWLNADLTIARWNLVIDDLGDGRCRLRWRLVYSGLGEQGNRIIAEKGFSERMHNTLRFLAISMKCYVETGTIYRLPKTRKAEIAAALIGAAIGRHFRRRRQA